MVLLSIISLTITILIVAFFIIQQNRLKRESATQKKQTQNTSVTKKQVPVSEKSSETKILISKELEKLPEGYFVYNNCRVNGVDIEHLILSLNGIAVIKSVDHKGAVSNNGQTLYHDGVEVKNNYIGSLWDDALAVKKMATEECGEDFYIKTILCYPRAFVAVQAPIEGVAIVNLDFLRPLIQCNKTFILEKNLSLIKRGVSVR